MHGNVLSVTDSTIVANIRVISKKIGRRILEESIGASLNPRIIPLQSIAYVVRSATVHSDSESGLGHYSMIIGVLAGAGIGWLIGETITDGVEKESPSSNPYSGIGRGINDIITKLISTGVGIIIGGYIGDSIAHPVRWVEQQFNISNAADLASFRQLL